MLQRQIQLYRMRGNTGLASEVAEQPQISRPELLAAATADYQSADLVLLIDPRELIARLDPIAVRRRGHPRIPFTEFDCGVPQAKCPRNRLNDAGQHLLRLRCLLERH